MRPRVHVDPRAESAILASAERFMATVDKDGPIPAHAPHLGPCWTRPGWKCKFGYGRFRPGIGKRGALSVLAHRYSFELAHGRPPLGCVLHHCDNPGCVNPGHLFQGTKGDNNRDRDAKGRTVYPVGDANGSRLHPERVPQGEGHHAAKLTARQVIEIRRRAESGEARKDLVREFGVTKTTIASVIRRKIWKQVA